MARNVTGRFYVGYPFVGRCGICRLRRAQGARHLGAAMLVDRLVAGETLPLANAWSIDTRPVLIRAIEWSAKQTIGGALDVTA